MANMDTIYYVNNTQFQNELNNIADETDYINVVKIRMDNTSTNTSTICELPSDIFLRFKNLRVLELKGSLQKLINLPSLPPSLKFLNCSNNKLTQLPELHFGLTSLICTNNELSYLPKLPESLEQLHCYENNLTSLPELPKSLKNLSCHSNLLTSLPILPPNLLCLSCPNNQIKHLPSLPSLLDRINCSNNCIHYLPEIPDSLEELICGNNPFHSDCHMYIKDVNNYYSEDDVSYYRPLRHILDKIKTLNRFRELFYALKYKKQLRYLLWVKIREPKIREKYHPNHLLKMLSENGELDLDELDELLDKW